MTLAAGELFAAHSGIVFNTGGGGRGIAPDTRCVGGWGVSEPVCTQRARDDAEVFALLGCYAPQIGSPRTA